MVSSAGAYLQGVDTAELVAWIKTNEFVGLGRFMIKHHGRYIGLFTAEK